MCLQGTPFFMAPEVVLQADVGRQSDLWSVGCCVVTYIYRCMGDMCKCVDIYTYICYSCRCICMTSDPSGVAGYHM